MFVTTDFWLDVLKIIMIDLMLSGDNAVVIALACRNLPAAQRKQGVLYGMTGAVVLRIVLTFFAVNLLSLPYLKLAGALLLIWVGIKLIQPEVEPDEGAVKADVRLIGAVKTIIIADFVMSLDNVLGVAVDVEAEFGVGFVVLLHHAHIAGVEQRDRAAGENAAFAAQVRGPGAFRHVG